MGEAALKMFSQGPFLSRLEPLEAQENQSRESKAKVFEKIFAKIFSKRGCLGKAGGASAAEYVLPVALFVAT